MKTFCHYKKTEIKKKIKISVDVFITKRKTLVHFAFVNPLMLYHFYDELICFVQKEWDERKFFLEDYKMIYPHVISLSC